MSNAKKPAATPTTSSTTPTNISSSSSSKLTSTEVTTSAAPVMENFSSSIDDEELELEIYTDDDESAGDLSDDEPPIEEQDISGRPQSQFKLRVTSAIGDHNHISGASGGGFSLPGDSDYLDDYNEEQFKALDLNKQTEKTAPKGQTRTSSNSKDHAAAITKTSPKTSKQSKLPSGNGKIVK